MKLSDLLAVFPSKTISIEVPAVDRQSDSLKNEHRKNESRKNEPWITGIHCDSRTVEPGGLFVALTGFCTDGHEYITEAIDRGAVAIAVDRTVNAPVTTIQVANTRKALAVFASRFYGDPSCEMTVIGITGTNGKTTTSYLVENILKAAGLRVGVIGTINYRYGDKEVSAPVTTPEASDLQKMLRQMRNDGVTHVVMEVSSHALALNRLDGCAFDVGVFTNLSQDHLDFHQDMISYWNCKKRLFTDFLSTGPKKKQAVAVINHDDSRGVQLADELDLPVVAVGRGEQHQVFPVQVDIGQEGIAGTICLGKDTSNRGPVDTAIHSHLTGGYNLENILCAAGVGMALRLSPDTIRTGIDATRRVPGRLESVENTAGIFVFVDYAHTPDALENALENLKNTMSGRLICIAGCGGNRDRAKRPQMAAIAVRLSDLSIFTSDNPREESPMAIIEDMLTGINNGCRAYTATHLPGSLDPSGYVVEPDRRRAIQMGIGWAKAGDSVLIAGKGHETYQLIADRRIAFDDRLEAAQALKKKYPAPPNE